MQRARSMMTSEQLKAFDVGDVPAKELAAYGDTPFGRGCLAAVRLIQTGVRCVEVTLNGWDTHANNLEGQATQVKILDAAYASLIRDLKRLGLLESTIVVCGGEFGRTPKINNVGGRDHWPHAFSMLVAGGGFRGRPRHGCHRSRRREKGAGKARPRRRSARHRAGPARDRLQQGSHDAYWPSDGAQQRRSGERFDRVIDPGHGARTSESPMR
jgi:hypothetical protein